MRKKKSNMSPLAVARTVVRAAWGALTTKKTRKSKPQRRKVRRAG